MTTKKPKTEFDTSDGLHILKDKLKDKTGIRAYCRHLTKEDHLEKVIEATRKAAAEREGDYRLTRLPPRDIDRSQRERTWERGIYDRWSVTNGVSTIPGCWDRIISVQVPLYAVRKKDGWGSIDLLGYRENSRECLPVVVELKKEPKAETNGLISTSCETPLRMVLEAAAYAVALQENWGNFRKEFADHLAYYKTSKKSKLPKKLRRVPLVAAAPASFWLEWSPLTKAGRTKPVQSDTWKEFGNLLSALGTEGFPVSFLSLSGDPYYPDSLAAQPLVGFPPSSC